MTSTKKSRCGSHVVVRTLHTLMTLGVLATLIFQSTDLSKTFHSKDVLQWLYGIGFILLVNASLILYWTTCLMDPGYVPVTKQRYDDSDDEAGEGMMHTGNGHTLENGVKLRRCGFCGIDQPLRARHCEDCDRCVRKFDHHCPWLETCVGERNHKFFWLFLASKTAVILWAFYIVWHSFTSHPNWVDWLKANALLLVDAAVLVVSGFTATALCGIHTYLMVSNTTTWEYMARHRITYLKRVHHTDNPFHEGYCKNTARFLCSWSIMSWEALYNKRMAGKMGRRARNMSSGEDEEQDSAAL